MNWFKDLFIRKDSQAESIPTPIKREPDISEPVISFVKTFKHNPKRFKVIRIKTEEDDNWEKTYYKLVDKKADLSWDFRNDFYKGITYYNTIRIYDTTQYPDFLTFDEFHFISETLKAYFTPRNQKYWNLRMKRRERDKNKVLYNKREALKKVYCGDSI